MLLSPAVEDDYAAIIDLVNLAFRGSGSSASWNIETGILEGQRMNDSLLRDDLAAKPASHLLTYRDEDDGPLLRDGPLRRDRPLLGTVWLDPGDDGNWYLGLLTVRPDLQNRQLGRTLLAAAEDFAKQRGARVVRMSVLNVREALIAWYERRGYIQTGETKPFPYGDERFGRPLRDDLHFIILKRNI